MKLQNVDSIPEFERSRFMSKWDQDLYGILDALNHEIVDLNVFAEEALIVLNCPLAAYQVGNQIIDLFAGKRVYAPDENDIPKIKLCLHAGPILSITSRFSKNPTYFGDALRTITFLPSRICWKILYLQQVGLWQCSQQDLTQNLNLSIPEAIS